MSKPTPPKPTTPKSTTPPTTAPSKHAPAHARFAPPKSATPVPATLPVNPPKAAPRPSTEPLPGSVGPVDPQTTWIEIAKVARPHGIKGDLRIHLYNPASEVWGKGLRLRAWMPGRPAVMLEVTDFRDILPMPTAKFVGVDDRDVAAKLTHAALSIDQAELPEADDGEFYLHEIMGATVLDAGTRAPVGTVTAILETPLDVLEITLLAGGIAMVPVNADAITELGRKPGELVVENIDDWRA